MDVLYATDGSAPAREAERLIGSLFDPAAVRVHVFSVTPEPVLPAASMYPGYEMDRLDLPTANAGETAREGAEHLAAHGFEASSSAARGYPALEILKLLEAHKHDLVVLGAGHTTWLGNMLLGSVSTHVLHHASMPVLVAHRAPAGAGKILLAIDGSRAAMHSAELATKLLDRTKCSLTVANAVSEPWLSVAVYPPGPPFGGYPEYKELQERRMEYAWELVESACREMKDAGFTCDSAVLAGSAGAQLLKEADNIGADLVVVGSRGLGPMKRALLGSVSDQVVRHAPATLVGRS